MCFPFVGFYTKYTILLQSQSLVAILFMLLSRRMTGVFNLVVSNEVLKILGQNKCTYLSIIALVWSPDFHEDW